LADSPNKANIHAFLETDDRINAVMKQLDEAVQELDDMDSHITGYKMQLNVCSARRSQSFKS
jgi:hypothetical protein